MADIVPDGTNFIKGSYKNAAGSRAYRLFTPSGYHGPAIPLVIMLHGCTQSPEDCAAGTRMNFVVREESRIVYGCRIILGIAAIDFAGIPGVVVDFLAKSNEGFRRIGSRDSLLKAMLERRFGCGRGNGERRASRICFALGSIRSST
jgi:esterase/PHB depolymerase